MKPLKLLLVALTITTLLASCRRENSEDVNQDKIYADYVLFYDANTDITYARATFRFSGWNGTKLELTSPSTVTFNGDALLWKNGLAYYEKEYSGLVSSGDFVWKDTAGKSFTNSISVKAIDFPTTIADISQSSSFSMDFTGGALAPDEVASLWADGGGEWDAHLFLEDADGATAILMEKNKIAGIALGATNLVMERSYLPGLAEATSAGGTINGRYRPVNRTTNIVQ